MFNLLQQVEHIKKKVESYLRQYESGMISEKTCKALMRRYLPDKEIEEIFKRLYTKKE